MRITATVEVDMTPHVRDDLLLFGDTEVRHLYGHVPVGAPLHITLRIGSARSVVWTERAVDALVGAQSVALVGSSSLGLSAAMSDLQHQFESRAA
jgi:hypothetical protein